MKEDLSLLERLHHGLCQAVERGGIICFGKKKARGYCKKHYKRWYKHGSIDLPKKSDKKCKFIDCNEPLHAKEYCCNHYLKHVWRSEKKKNKCCVVDCNKSCNGTKYCSMHFSRIYRYESLEGNGRKKGQNSKPPPYIKSYKKCLAPSCDRDSNSFKIVKGLCTKHYQRWNIHKDYNVVSQKGKRHGRHSEQMG